MKKKILLIPLALLLAISLVAIGCAPPAPAPPVPAPPAPAPPAPAPPAPAPPAPPAPPPEVEVFKWAFQHAMSSAEPLYKENVDMCDRIEAISGGRLKIKVYAEGEIVSVFEPPYGIKDGVVDMQVGGLSAIFGSVGPAVRLMDSGMPAGLSGPDFLAWFYGGDGWELANEAEEGWGQVIGAMSSTPELFCHSNVKIETAEDLKGLRFRTYGLWAEIMKGYGASVVTLPGGEIYSAAERGVIDAFEYCGAATNWPMGFHEITKYLGIPGIHSPTAERLYLVNYDAWDKLPDDLKLLLKGEIERVGFSFFVHETYLDAEAMEKYVEYGTEIVTVSDELQQDIARRARAWCEKQFEDPLFKKTFESQRDFITTYKAASGTIPKYSIFD